MIGKKIYPLLVPQAVKLPAISYKRISTVRAQSKDGLSGLAEARFEFACWGKSFAESKSVAAELKTYLASFSGSNGSVNVLLDGESDVYEDETGTYCVLVDFLVWHQERS